MQKSIARGFQNSCVSVQWKSDENISRRVGNAEAIISRAETGLFSFKLSLIITCREIFMKEKTSSLPASSKTRLSK